MRSLKFTDVFTVSRILKKMNIKIDFQSIQSGDQLGIELILKFMEGIGDAEEEVTAFFADLKGVKTKEIKELDFEQSAELLKEFQELPGLKSFFMSVGKLMK